MELPIRSDINTRLIEDDVVKNTLQICAASFSDLLGGKKQQLKKSSFFGARMRWFFN